MNAGRAILCPHSLKYRSFFVQPLVHCCHHNQISQQIEGHETYSDMIRYQPEQGRRQTGAYIGAGHLHADKRLRSVRAEVPRRGMDNAGVDWRAAQPYKAQTCEGEQVSRRKEQGGNTCRDDAKTKPDHLAVAELYGDKTADGASGCDADKKQPGVAGRRLRRHALIEVEIAACPEYGGLLQSTIAEEADHDLFCPGDGNDLP